MYINYDKIIPANLNDLISSDELAELKKIALKERNYIRSRVSHEALRLYPAQIAYDAVYKGAKYQAMNDVKKALIYQNIILDDETVIKVLTRSNCDLDLLKKVLSVIKYLKNKTENANLNKKDEIYAERADTYAKYLVSKFNSYNAINDPNAIINKLIEMTAYNPELLLSLNNENRRTR